MGYIDPQAVLDAGLLNVDEGDIQDSIDLWSGFLDRACRQWFEPRTTVLLLDGNGSDTLFLPVPIITLSALYLNSDFVNAADLSIVEVYNGNGIADDRKNPKIRLNSSIYARDIFLPLQRRVGAGFARGNRNQRLEGTFGYVEPDGSTPLLIQRAVLRLVMINAGSKGLQQSIASSGGWVKSESTDGHSVSYGFPDLKVGTIGITRDAEVETIIQMYKGPIAIAAPSSRGSGSWWSLG